MSVFMDVDKVSVLKDSYGTYYLINCKYFVPSKYIWLFEVYPKDRGQDTVRCSKHTHKHKRYSDVTVIDCIVCGIKSNVLRVLGNCFDLRYVNGVLCIV